MYDIAPELLEKIQASFRKNMDGSPQIQALAKSIGKGLATYPDALEYADMVGKALSQALLEHISSDTLPDGRMYYNIAQRVLRPMLEDDYQIISQAVQQVQEALNKNAGLGIQAQVAPLNTDRIDGLVNKVSNAADFNEVAWVLNEPISTYSMSVVDESLKANVNFHGKSGLSPRIIRKAEPKCCKWCSTLAGEYDYPDAPDDIYRRHENCRCTVQYDPGDGRRQDVHTKRWTTDEKGATIEARKFIGLKTNGVQIQGVSDHVILRMKERGVTPEAMLDAIQNSLDIGDTKTDEFGRQSFRVIGEKATLYINPETKFIITAHCTHTKTASKLKRRADKK